MNHSRERLAQEAARLSLEYGESNLDAALHKAAQRLGIRQRHLWPKRADLEAALRQHHRLFADPAQANTIQTLRKETLALMLLLSEYHPRLSGALLQDHAGQNTPIQLHLFCQRSEDVLLRLMDLGIQFKTSARYFRYPDGNRREHPLIRLEEDGIQAELICFPLEKRHGASPLAPLDQRPMPRLSIKGLEQLLAKENESCTSW